MGVTLVLITWLIWLAVFVGVGHAASAVVSRQWTPRARVEASAWIGLVLVSAMAASLQFLLPIGGRSSAVIVTVVGLFGIGSVCRLAWLHRYTAGCVLLRSVTWRRWPAVSVVALFAMGLILAANFALSEPMDADAGLYRIGSIRYAEEYGLLPGLANLHARFGFNSTLWPLAALSSSGPWQGMGYRVVTGLFLTVLLWSIVMRVGLTRRSGAMPGDWFTVLGAAFTAAMIFTDSGRWVPSPAQDLVVLVAGIGSTAFLLDFLSRRAGPESAASALVLAAFAGTLRPLGWGLFAATAAVVLSTSIGKGVSACSFLARSWALIGRASVLSVVMLIVMLARDVLLSGWLLYPLPYLPVAVDWRAPDPTSVQQWITWYARAPGLDGTSAKDGTWVMPWIESTWYSREATLIRWMVAAALLPLVWRAGRAAWRVSWRVICLALVPSAMVTIAWFVSAPDLRFGWIGLVGVAAIPISVLLSAGVYPYWVARVAGVTLLLLLLVTQVLNGRVLPRGGAREPVALPLGTLSLIVSLALPPRPQTVPGTLADGTPIVYPTLDGNCWAAFPLCLLPGTGANAEKRGQEISRGFRAAD